MLNLKMLNLVPDDFVEYPANPGAQPVVWRVKEVLPGSPAQYILERSKADNLEAGQADELWVQTDDPGLADLSERSRHLLWMF